MARGQYPKRKDEEDDYEEESSMLDTVKQFASKDLEDIGLQRAHRLEKAYGKDDLRVKKAKLECFFNAYAILGTVRYAAQVVGLNPKAVSKVIKNNPAYQARFEVAHDEFCEYLEQTAIVRAVSKSDSLLQFLLKAYNPRKFSERLRIQALEKKDDDDTPLTLTFGEYTPDWTEPNFKFAEVVVDTDNEEEVEDNE